MLGLISCAEVTMRGHILHVMLMKYWCQGLLMSPQTQQPSSHTQHSAE